MGDIETYRSGWPRSVRIPFYNFSNSGESGVRTLVIAGAVCSTLCSTCCVHGLGFGMLAQHQYTLSCMVWLCIALCTQYSVWQTCRHFKATCSISSDSCQGVFLVCLPAWLPDANLNHLWNGADHPLQSKNWSCLQQLQYLSTNSTHRIQTWYHE